MKEMNFKLHTKLQLGFTLVELLIVISLLSAIALIVIAAINPIEQANRARDARFKADSSQLLSAVERYFAAKSEFPWTTYDVAQGGSSVTSETELAFVTAGDPTVGLCGDAGCTTTGTLVAADELKNEFANRDFVKATTVDKKIFLGKGQGSSSSVYACFIPLSKSVRKQAVKDLKVRTLSFSSTGSPESTAACDADNADWTTIGCYVCIPD
ncbi:prepilin-type N-terminal cleavage/methylation domain-containing protein [Candidatus Microgenomates bacterium]|nr:prepilin-type N-terminal cleavage/methylation domain-containing protein [Candidatus Microgenomates bacterium]